MSYPGIDPADVQTMNPVGTQEPSAGAHRVNPLLSRASETMHEEALRRPVQSFERSAEQFVTPSELNNVVQAAVSDMFALNDTWKPKQNGGATRFVIQCPSGQTVLARHLDTMDLLEAGLIDELDFFTKKLFPRKLDPAGNPDDSEDENDGAEIWVILKDIEKRKRFIDLLNKLVDTAIERPRVINDGVEIATDDNGKRFLITGAEMSADDYVKVFGKVLPKLKDNETYASAVDFTDKMKIFGELNKPLSVIQPFREQAVSVANVGPSESVGG